MSIKRSSVSCLDPYTAGYWRHVLDQLVILCLADFYFSLHCFKNSNIMFFMTIWCAVPVFWLKWNQHVEVIKSESYHIMIKGAFLYKRYIYQWSYMVLVYLPHEKKKNNYQKYKLFWYFCSYHCQGNLYFFQCWNLCVVLFSLWYLVYAKIYWDIGFCKD